MGQHAAATGVKCRSGSPSTLGEKVTSGLVWRFGTFDCVSNNLTCFEDGFGDRGSFLDVGGHHFYIAKPFLKEVTNVLDPLFDAGSSYSKGVILLPWSRCWPWRKKVAEAHRAPRACRLNVHLYQSKTLSLQSGTSWTPPS
jgi:hypothetical protein